MPSQQPRDPDALLVRSTAWRVALTITIAVSILVIAVLAAAFIVVFTQIPVGDLLGPKRTETVVDVEGTDILVGAAVIGVSAVAVSGILGWLVTRRAVRPLVDALRRQRQFVADASHELRTPLAILDARIQMLQRSLRDSDPHHDVVAQLRDDSRSVIGVVSDLLESVEVETGAVVVPTSVAVALDAAISAMSVLARDRNVHLARTPFAGDPLALIPRERLQRILVALLDNAVKHSPVGGTVTVSAHRSGAHVLIDVADEGPGIQGIDPSRVFERFARSSNAVDGGGSTRTGFGIGLSLVQDTVSRYRGSARVSSTTSDGTVITIRLPIANRRRPSAGL